MKQSHFLHILIFGISVIPLFAQEQKIEPSTKGSRIAAQAESGNPGWIVPAVFTKQAELADCTNGEVHVTILLETDRKARPYLAARLTPNSGFYISSKNLPEGFMGCPTCFTLVTNTMVRAWGPVFEDTPAQEALEEPDCMTSYYPAGTVTLRLPVEFIRADSDISAQVKLNYSACNNEVCTMPGCGSFDIRISAATLSAIGIPAPHPTD